MRRAAAFSFCLFALGLLCLGQQPRAWWQSVPQVTEIAFTGEGDIASGALAYGGVKAYNKSYSGNILNICDQATGLVCADATWSSNEGISLPLVGGLACNNVTNICVVSKAYDTTGNGKDFTQTTNSQRPTLIIPGAANGCPTTTAYCLGFVAASSQCLVTTGTFTQAQPLSLVAIATRTGSLASGTQIISLSVSTQVMTFPPIVNSARINFGSTTTVTATDSAWHSLQGVGNGASGSLSVDGATTTGNNGTNSSVASVLSAGGNSLCATSIDGKMVSWGLWPSDLAASASAMSANAHAYPSAW